MPKPSRNSSSQRPSGSISSQHGGIAPTATSGPKGPRAMSQQQEKQPLTRKRNRSISTDSDATSTVPAKKQATQRLNVVKPAPAKTVDAEVALVRKLISRPQTRRDHADLQNSVDSQASSLDGPDTGLNEAIVRTYAVTNVMDSRTTSHFEEFGKQISDIERQLKTKLAKQRKYFADELNQQREDFNTLRASYKSEDDRIEADVRRLRTRIENKLKRIGINQNAIESHANTLRGKVSRMNTKLDSLKAASTGQARSISGIEAKHSGLEDKVEQLMSRIGALEKTEDERKRAQEELSETVKTLQEKNDTLAKLVKEQSIQTNKIDTRIDLTSSELGHVKDDFEVRYRDFKADIEDTRQTAKQESQHEALSAKLDSAILEFNRFKEAMTTKEKQVTTYVNQLRKDLLTAVQNFRHNGQRDIPPASPNLSTPPRNVPPNPINQRPNPRTYTQPGTYTQPRNPPHCLPSMSPGVGWRG